MFENKNRLPLYLLAIFLLSLAPRLLSAYYAPLFDSSDFIWSYKIVAENIYQSGCVSQSIIVGECKPHWGGNQLPGYPLFIAVVWKMFNHSNLAILIVQSTLLSLAITYLFYVLTIRFTKQHKIIPFAVASLLIISPLVLVFSRVPETEILTIALRILLIAILIRSITINRLLILGSAFTYTAAMFVRYDNILLGIPIIIAAFIIYKPQMALKKLLLGMVICSIPMGGWWMRSVANGLPVFPPANFPVDTLDVSAWFNTWIKDRADTYFMLAMFHAKNYSELQVRQDIFYSDTERNKTADLWSKLKKADGNFIPQELNRDFRDLTQMRKEASWFDTVVVLKLVRMRNYWFNFGYYHWAVGKYQENLHFLRKLVYLSYDIYRMALTPILFLLTYLIFRKKAPIELKFLTGGVALFVVLYTIFYGMMPLILTRYILTTVPLLEAAIVASLAWLYVEHKNKVAIV
ncbi:MAG: glycosyltransferase family 39 protein [Magnetococcales bacterium]|nr:glycosyltransferase family 39 protein [Magnetococcales bacterium]